MVAALVVSVCPIWMCSHGMVDGIRIFYETNFASSVGDCKGVNRGREDSGCSGSARRRFEDFKRRVPTGSDPLHN